MLIRAHTRMKCLIPLRVYFFFKGHKWLEQYRDRSITELEVIYGALQHTLQQQQQQQRANANSTYSTKRPHAFFYFRKPKTAPPAPVKKGEMLLAGGKAAAVAAAAAAAAASSPPGDLAQARLQDLKIRIWYKFSSCFTNRGFSVITTM